MEAVGIVVEYNPFHNGHAFHLQESKRITGGEVVIAVMSGNFLQRGEPALLSKWYRAKMALHSGVDLVVELPYPFASQKADTFAFGAVSILQELDCKWICFGSESGNIETFSSTIDFLTKHHEKYELKIEEQIKKGVSYPKALALAYSQLQPPEHTLDISQPNNILGIQYVNAIKKINGSIVPVTIKRKSAQYHDDTFHANDTIASATSIRKAIFDDQSKWLQSIKPYAPLITMNILQEYYAQFATFHHWETYWPLLKYRLLQASPEELRKVYEVEEGIEHRLIKASLTSESFQQFMEKIKTKRYTWTRLQRLCVHILLNVSKDDMSQRMEKPTYIRLLGMSTKGRKYLREKKKNFNLPLIAKLSSYKENDIALDIHASRIYALGVHNDKQYKLIKMEYDQPPLFVE